MSEDKKNPKSNPALRTAAFFTLLTFLSSSVSAQTSVPVSPVLPAALIPAEGIKIPESLGSVETQHTGTSGKPWVIYIQDAHAILDAQKNIQRVIAYLQEHYGVDLVAVEGAQGKLDPTLLRAFPDAFVKEKTMRSYWEKAELSGGEMAAIFSEKETGFYGIENWNEYKDNYHAYLQALQVQPQMDEMLGQWHARLDKERAQVYGAELNHFHETVSAFREEKSNLMDLWRYLARNAGPGAFAKYPHLVKLFTVFPEDENVAKSKNIDADLRSLGEGFKKKILPKLPQKQGMEFSRVYQDYASSQIDAASFLRKIMEISGEAGFSLRLSPEMKRILGNAETLSHIKGTRLFEELELYLAERQSALAASPEQKALAGRYDEWQLFRCFIRLELNRDQWEKIKQNPFSLTPAFRIFLSFYETAEKRDRIFHQNLEKLIARQKCRSAAVLTGGFHARGFEEALQKSGYSYAVILPKMDSLKGEDLYQDAMRGKFSFKRENGATLYDAFSRDAVLSLVSSLSEPDFRKDLKLWRDEVIRQLAKEGRLAEASRYTRYLDDLFKVYYDKFGDRSPKSKEEIIAALENELRKIHKENSERIWDQFQTRLQSLSAGLRSLAGQKNLNQKSFASLWENVMSPRSSGVAIAIKLDATAPTGDLFTVPEETAGLPAGTGYREILEDLARGIPEPAAVPAAAKELAANVLAAESAVGRDGLKDSTSADVFKSMVESSANSNFAAQVLAAVRNPAIPVIPTRKADGLPSAARERSAARSSFGGSRAENRDSEAREVTVKAGGAAIHITVQGGKITITANGEEKTKTLTAGQMITVGRYADADDHIQVTDESSYLSRLQFYLQYDGKDWLIKHGGGQNATLINGVAVSNQFEILPAALVDFSVKQNESLVLDLASRFIAEAEDKGISLGQLTGVIETIVNPEENDIRGAVAGNLSVKAITEVNRILNKNPEFRDYLPTILLHLKGITRGMAAERKGKQRLELISQFEGVRQQYLDEEGELPSDISNENLAALGLFLLQLKNDGLMEAAPLLNEVERMKHGRSEAEQRERFAKYQPEILEIVRWQRQNGKDNFEMRRLISELTYRHLERQARAEGIVSPEFVFNPENREILQRMERELAWLKFEDSENPERARELRFTLSQYYASLPGERRENRETDVSESPLNFEALKQQSTAAYEADGKQILYVNRDRYEFQLEAAGTEPRLIRKLAAEDASRDLSQELEELFNARKKLRIEISRQMFEAEGRYSGNREILPERYYQSLQQNGGTEEWLETIYTQLKEKIAANISSKDDLDQIEKNFEVLRNLLRLKTKLERSQLQPEKLHENGRRRTLQFKAAVEELKNRSNKVVNIYVGNQMGAGVMGKAQSIAEALLFYDPEIEINIIVKDGEFSPDHVNFKNTQENRIHWLQNASSESARTARVHVSVHDDFKLPQGDDSALFELAPLPNTQSVEASRYAGNLLMDSGTLILNPQLYDLREKSDRWSETLLVMRRLQWLLGLPEGKTQTALTTLGEKEGWDPLKAVWSWGYFQDSENFLTEMKQMAQGLKEASLKTEGSIFHPEGKQVVLHLIPGKWQYPQLNLSDLAALGATVIKPSGEIIQAAGDHKIPLTVVIYDQIDNAALRPLQSQLSGTLMKDEDNRRISFPALVTGDASYLETVSSGHIALHDGYNTNANAQRAILISLAMRWLAVDQPELDGDALLAAAEAAASGMLMGDSSHANRYESLKSLTEWSKEARHYSEALFNFDMNQDFIIALAEKTKAENQDQAWKETLLKNGPGAMALNARTGLPEKEIAISRKGNHFVIRSGDFAMLSSEQHPNLILDTSPCISACTGVGVKANKDGTEHYGLGHIWNNAGYGDPEPSLAAQLQRIHAQIQANGFQKVQYVVDYRNNLYAQEPADLEREVREKIPDASFVFQMRRDELDEISDEFRVTAEGVEMKPTENSTGSARKVLWKQGGENAPARSEARPSGLIANAGDGQTFNISDLPENSRLRKVAEYLNEKGVTGAMVVGRSAWGLLTQNTDEMPRMGDEEIDLDFNMDVDLELAPDRDLSLTDSSQDSGLEAFSVKEYVKEALKGVDVQGLLAQVIPSQGILRKYIYTAPRSTKPSAEVDIVLKDKEQLEEFAAKLNISAEALISHHQTVPAGGFQFDLIGWFGKDGSARTVKDELYTRPSFSIHRAGVILNGNQGIWYGPGKSIEDAQNRHLRWVNPQKVPLTVVDIMRFFSFYHDLHSKQGYTVDQPSLEEARNQIRQAFDLTQGRQSRHLQFVKRELAFVQKIRRLDQAYKQAGESRFRKAGLAIAIYSAIYFFMIFSALFTARDNFAAKQFVAGLRSLRTAASVLVMVNTKFLLIRHQLRRLTLDSPYAKLVLFESLLGDPYPDALTVDLRKAGDDDNPFNEIDSSWRIAYGLKQILDHAQDGEAAIREMMELGGEWLLRDSGIDPETLIQDWKLSKTDPQAYAQKMGTLIDQRRAEVIAADQALKPRAETRFEDDVQAAADDLLHNHGLPFMGEDFFYFPAHLVNPYYKLSTAGRKNDAEIRQIFSGALTAFWKELMDNQGPGFAEEDFDRYAPAILRIAADSHLEYAVDSEGSLPASMPAEEAAGLKSKLLAYAPYVDDYDFRALSAWIEKLSGVNRDFATNEMMLPHTIADIAFDAPADEMEEREGWAKKLGSRRAIAASLEVFKIIWGKGLNGEGEDRTREEVDQIIDYINRAVAVAVGPRAENRDNLEFIKKEALTFFNSREAGLLQTHPDFAEDLQAVKTVLEGIQDREQMRAARLQISQISSGDKWRYIDDEDPILKLTYDLKNILLEIITLDHNDEILGEVIPQLGAVVRYLAPKIPGKRYRLKRPRQDSPFQIVISYEYSDGYDAQIYVTANSGTKSYTIEDRIESTTFRFGQSSPRIQKIAENLTGSAEIKAALDLAVWAFEENKRSQELSVRSESDNNARQPRITLNLQGAAAAAPARPFAVRIQRYETQETPQISMPQLESQMRQEADFILDPEGLRVLSEDSEFETSERTRVLQQKENLRQEYEAIQQLVGAPFKLAVHSDFWTSQGQAVGTVPFNLPGETLAFLDSEGYVHVSLGLLTVGPDRKLFRIITAQLILAALAESQGHLPETLHNHMLNQMRNGDLAFENPQKVFETLSSFENPMSFLEYEGEWDDWVIKDPFEVFRNSETVLWERKNHQREDLLEEFLADAGKTLLTEIPGVSFHDEEVLKAFFSEKLVTMLLQNQVLGRILKDKKEISLEEILKARRQLIALRALLRQNFETPDESPLIDLKDPLPQDAVISQQEALEHLIEKNDVVVVHEDFLIRDEDGTPQLWKTLKESLPRDALFVAPFYNFEKRTVVDNEIVNYVRPARLHRDTGFTDFSNDINEYIQNPQALVSIAAKYKREDDLDVLSERDLEENMRGLREKNIRYFPAFESAMDPEAYAEELKKAFDRFQPSKVIILQPLASSRFPWHEDRKFLKPARNVKDGLLQAVENHFENQRVGSAIRVAVEEVNTPMIPENFALLAPIPQSLLAQPISKYPGETYVFGNYGTQKDRQAVLISRRPDDDSDDDERAVAEDPSPSGMGLELESVGTERAEGRSESRIEADKSYWNSQYSGKMPWEMTREEFDREIVFHGTRLEQSDSIINGSRWIILGRTDDNLTEGSDFTESYAEASKYAQNIIAGLGELGLVFLGTREAFQLGPQGSYTDSANSMISEGLFVKDAAGKLVSTKARTGAALGAIPASLADPYAYIVQQAVASGKNVPDEIASPFRAENRGEGAEESAARPTIDSVKKYFERDVQMSEWFSLHAADVEALKAKYGEANSAEFLDILLWRFRYFYFTFGDDASWRTYSEALITAVLQNETVQGFSTSGREPYAHEGPALLLKSLMDAGKLFTHRLNLRGYQWILERWEGVTTIARTAPHYRSDDFFSKGLGVLKEKFGQKWLEDHWPGIVKIVAHQDFEDKTIAEGLPALRLTFKTPWIDQHWDSVVQIAVEHPDSANFLFSNVLPGLHKKMGKKWTEEHWADITAVISAAKENASQVMYELSDPNGMKASWLKANWDTVRGLLIEFGPEGERIFGSDGLKFFEDRITPGNFPAMARSLYHINHDNRDSGKRSSSIRFTLREVAKIVTPENIDSVISQLSRLQQGLAVEYPRLPLQNLTAENLPKVVDDLIALGRAISDDPIRRTFFTSGEGLKSLIPFTTADNNRFVGDTLLDLWKSAAEKLAAEAEPETLRSWFFYEGIGSLWGLAKEENFRAMGEELIRIGYLKQAAFHSAVQKLERDYEAQWKSLEDLETAAQELSDEEEKIAQHLQAVRNLEAAITEFKSTLTSLISESQSSVILKHMLEPVLGHKSYGRPKNITIKNWAAAAQPRLARVKTTLEEVDRRLKSARTYEEWQDSITDLMKELISKYTEALDGDISLTGTRLGQETGLASITYGAESGIGMGLGMHISMRQTMTMAMLMKTFEMHDLITLDEERALAYGDQLIHALNVLIPHELGHPLLDRGQGSHFSISPALFQPELFAALGNETQLENMAKEVVVDRIGYALAAGVYTHNEKMPEADLSSEEKFALGLKDVTEILLNYKREKFEADHEEEADPALTILALARFEAELREFASRETIRPSIRRENEGLADEIHEFVLDLLVDDEHLDSYDALVFAFQELFNDTQVTLNVSETEGRAEARGIDRRKFLRTSFSLAAGAFLLAHPDHETRTIQEKAVPQAQAQKKAQAEVPFMILPENQKAFIEAIIEELFHSAAEKKFDALARQLSDPEWKRQLSIIPDEENRPHGAGYASLDGSVKTQIGIHRGTLNWALSPDPAGREILKRTLLHEFVHRQHYLDMSYKERSPQAEETLTRRETAAIIGEKLYPYRNPKNEEIVFGIYVAEDKGKIPEFEVNDQGVRVLRSFVNSYPGEIPQEVINKTTIQIINEILPQFQDKPKVREDLLNEIKRIEPVRSESRISPRIEKQLGSLADDFTAAIVKGGHRDDLYRALSAGDDYSEKISIAHGNINGRHVLTLTYEGEDEYLSFNAPAQGEWTQELHENENRRLLTEIRLRLSDLPSDKKTPLTPEQMIVRLEQDHQKGRDVLNREHPDAKEIQSFINLTDMRARFLGEKIEMEIGSTDAVKNLKLQLARDIRQARNLLREVKPETPPDIRAEARDGIHDLNHLLSKAVPLASGENARQIANEKVKAFLEDYKKQLMEGLLKAIADANGWELSLRFMDGDYSEGSEVPLFIRMKNKSNAGEQIFEMTRTLNLYQSESTADGPGTVSAILKLVSIVVNDVKKGEVPLYQRKGIAEAVYQTEKELLEKHLPGTVIYSELGNPRTQKLFKDYYGGPSLELENKSDAVLRGVSVIGSRSEARAEVEVSEIASKDNDRNLPNADRGFKLQIPESVIPGGGQVIAVFDGYQGDRVSQGLLKYTQQHLLDFLKDYSSPVRWRDILTEWFAELEKEKNRLLAGEKNSPTGSTASFVLQLSNNLYLANVGDSPILVSDSQLAPVYQSPRHALRNQVTRSFGDDADAEPAVKHVVLKPGNTYYITAASDGVILSDNAAKGFNPPFTSINLMFIWDMLRAVGAGSLTESVWSLVRDPSIGNRDDKTAILMRVSIPRDESKSVLEDSDDPGSSASTADMIVPELKSELRKAAAARDAAAAERDSKEPQSKRSEKRALEFNDEKISQRNRLVLGLNSVLPQEEAAFFESIYQPVYLANKEYLYTRKERSLQDMRLVGMGFAQANQVLVPAVVDELFEMAETNPKTRLVFLEAGAHPLAVIAETMARVTGEFPLDRLHNIWATMGMDNAMKSGEMDPSVFVRYLQQEKVLADTDRIIYADTDSRDLILGTETLFYRTLMNREVMGRMGLPVWNNGEESPVIEGLFMRGEDYSGLIQDQIRKDGFDPVDYETRIKIIPFSSSLQPNASMIAALHSWVDWAPKTQSVGAVIKEEGSRVALDVKPAYNQKYEGRQQVIYAALYDAMLRMGTLDILEARGYNVEAEQLRVMEKLKQEIAPRNESREGFYPTLEEAIRNAPPKTVGNDLSQRLFLTIMRNVRSITRENGQERKITGAKVLGIGGNTAAFRVIFDGEQTEVLKLSEQDNLADHQYAPFENKPMETGWITRKGIVQPAGANGAAGFFYGIFLEAVRRDVDPRIDAEGARQWNEVQIGQDFPESPYADQTPQQVFDSIREQSLRGEFFSIDPIKGKGYRVIASGAQKGDWGLVEDPETGDVEVKLLDIGESEFKPFDAEDTPVLQQKLAALTAELRKLSGPLTDVDVLKRRRRLSTSVTAFQHEIERRSENRDFIDGAQIMPRIRQLLDLASENSPEMTTGLREWIYFYQLALLHSKGILTKDTKVFNLLSGLDLFPGLFGSEMWTSDYQLNENQLRDYFEKAHTPLAGREKELGVHGKTVLPALNQLGVIHHDQANVLRDRAFISRWTGQMKAGDVVFLKFTNEYLSMWTKTAEEEDARLWLNAFLGAIPAGVHVILFERTSERYLFPDGLESELRKKGFEDEAPALFPEGEIAAMNQSPFLTKKQLGQGFPIYPASPLLGPILNFDSGGRMSILVKPVRAESRYEDIQFVDPARIPGFSVAERSALPQQEAIVQQMQNNMGAILQHIIKADSAAQLPNMPYVVNVGSGHHPLVAPAGWQKAQVLNIDEGSAFALTAAGKFDTPFRFWSLEAMSATRGLFRPGVILLHEMGTFIQLYRGTNGSADFWHAAWDYLPEGGWLVLLNSPVNRDGYVQSLFRTYQNLTDAIPEITRAKTIGIGSMIWNADAIIIQKPVRNEKRSEDKISTPDFKRSAAENRSEMRSEDRGEAQSDSPLVNSPSEGYRAVLAKDKQREADLAFTKKQSKFYDLAVKNRNSALSMRAGVLLEDLKRKLPEALQKSFASPAFESRWDEVYVIVADGVPTYASLLHEVDSQFKREPLIVMNAELVEKWTDEELTAVLAHELGHVWNYNAHYTARDLMLKDKELFQALWQEIEQKSDLVALVLLQVIYGDQAKGAFKSAFEKMDELKAHVEDLRKQHGFEVTDQGFDPHMEKNARDQWLDQKEALLTAPETRAQIFEELDQWPVPLLQEPEENFTVPGSRYELRAAPPQSQRSEARPDFVPALDQFQNLDFTRLSYGELESILLAAAQKKRTDFDAEFDMNVKMTLHALRSMEPAVFESFIHGGEGTLDAFVDFLSKSLNEAGDHFSTAQLYGAALGIRVLVTFGEKPDQPLSISSENLDYARMDADLRGMKNLIRAFALQYQQNLDLTVNNPDAADRETVQQGLQMLEDEGVLNMLSMMVQPGEPFLKKIWTGFRLLVLSITGSNANAVLKSRGTSPGKSAGIIMTNDMKISGKDLGLFAAVAKIKQISDPKLREVAYTSLLYAMTRVIVLGGYQKFMTRPDLLREELNKDPLLSNLLSLDPESGNFVLGLAQLTARYAASQAALRAA